MNFRNHTYVSLLLSILALFTATLCFFNRQESVVYIDSKKVFDSFNMTSEFRLEAEEKINFQNKELDSLQAQLSNERNYALRTHLLEVMSLKKQQAENFNYNFSVEKTELIWKRIKAYAKEFSESNNYELILGAQQNSNVIYGDEKIDVTADFLKYINERYEDNN